MNKQELIERIKKLDEPYLKAEFVLELVKQLDEPQPVKVPQFVADWYEENKDEFELNLWMFLTEFDEENIDMSEMFGIWLGDEDNNPIQTLVNMHQFGYEVEKEKRYSVKIRATKHYFDKDGNGRVYFSLAYKSCFTKKQLEEAGFGWVFDCPGIEIEEVEE